MLALKARKIVAGLIAFGMLIFLSASQGRADSGGKIQARLSGFQEVPANLTPATGRFEARIKDDRIEFKFTYSNLTGAPTAAHIHLGQRGVNGGVFTFLCGGSRPACPEGTATVEGTIMAADILALPTQNLTAGDLAAAIRAIRHGVTYVNIHTPNSPAGEMRGQITPDFDFSSDDE